MYPGSRPRGGGSLYPASNLVYDHKCLHGAAVGGFVSLILHVYDIRCLWDILCYVSLVPLGAPLSGFIYATGQEFTRVLVEYGLESSFFYSKSIFESLFWSISIMGQTRYTNLRVPKGHSLVSSPRDSIRVADSGWVSKNSNFRLLQSLSSYIFDFFYSMTSLNSSSSLNFDFSILKALEIFSPDGSKCWVHGLEILLEIIHLQIFDLVFWLIFLIIFRKGFWWTSLTTLTGQRSVNCRNRYLPPTSNSIPLDLNSGYRSNPFFCRI
jgi:hypothetical protein